MTDKLCHAPVTHIVTWFDGRQMRCCQNHAAQMTHILRLLGHGVHVIILPQPTDDGCTQHVNDSNASP